MLALAKQRKVRKAACQQVSDISKISLLWFWQHTRFRRELLPLGRMTQRASRFRYLSIFFLMWRMFSCLRCCARQKSRMTEDFTIPSPQRSSVPSNIPRCLGSYFLSLYMCCTQLLLRTIEAIRTGTLPVTAQLLPTFLFPDDHVYDSNDISANVLRGHVMIRVYLILIFLIF